MKTLNKIVNKIKYAQYEEEVQSVAFRYNIDISVKKGLWKALYLWWKESDIDKLEEKKNYILSLKENLV